MIDIRLMPYGIEQELKVDSLEVIASGVTYEEVLGQLIKGINEDTIDTENNRLILFSS